MKRIRKELGEKKIKYFACGEYGDKTYRPHYHMIILGLDSKEAKDIVERKWKYGDIHIGSATAQSIAYTASYVNKKILGTWAKEAYIKAGREPPFHLVSKGVGRRYAEKWKDEIIENLSIRKNGVELGVPRYYRKVLEIESEVMKVKADEKRQETREYYEERGGLSINGRRLKKTAEIDDDMWNSLDQIEQARYQRSLNFKAKMRDNNTRNKI